MIQGAVFDMEGLMFDTEKLVFENWKEITARLGYDFTLDIFKKTIGKRRIETEKLLKGIYGEDFPYLDIAEMCHVLFVDKTDRNGIPVKKGLKSLLEHFKETGVKLAVATSTRRGSATRALEMTGVLPCFDAVVCGEDVKNGKPDPEVFLTAAGKLGVLPEYCVAFEDSYNGLIAAHRAGMTTVMVPDLLPPTKEIMPYVTHLCRDLDEARSVFNSMV